MVMMTFREFIMVTCYGKKLVLSSINYASAVWVPGGASDSKRIESLQYQMARIILKAPRNTPLECLLGELGWQPISLVQNKLRIKYSEFVCQPLA